MSVFHRVGWGRGFPFSDNALHLAGDPRSAPGMGINGLARINHGQILDGHSRLSDTTSGRNDVIGPRPGPSPAIRLLPLQGFVWGGGTALHPRSHSDHALIWVTQGTSQLAVARQNLRLQSGDLRWIPAGTAFATPPGPGVSGWLLLISPSLVQDLQPAFPHAHFAAQATGDTQHLLTLMRNIELLATGGTRTPPLMRHLGLLAMTLDEMAPERPRAAAGIIPMAGPELIDRFEELARAAGAEALTISDLARKLGCSTATLDRACIAHCGRRAVERVNEMRLERAMQMLRETRLNPMRIAADLGYASYAHFARALADATGRRPEAFRAQAG